jgi:hypothetical protein
MSAAERTAIQALHWTGTDTGPGPVHKGDRGARGFCVLDLAKVQGQQEPRASL